MAIITYTFKLTRYEKQRNNLGTVIAIFIAIQCTDSNNNIYVREYWLNPAEVASVVSLESNLNSILITQSKIAQVATADMVAKIPQPPIIANQTKLDSFIIVPIIA